LADFPIFLSFSGYAVATRLSPAAVNAALADLFAAAEAGRWLAHKPI